jgi:molybdopterin-guanine dinucleotide biosynthesis protein A
VAEAGLTCRVVAKDAVSRCGPLGGIYTCLASSRAEAEIFLACDMPFITSELLLKLVASFEAHRGRAVFSSAGDKASFPCILPIDILGLVEKQIQLGEFSLQKLAKVTGGKRWKPPNNRQLFNVNTPEDLEAAKELVKKQRTAACKSTSNR